MTDRSFNVLGVRISAESFNDVLSTALRAPDSGERLSFHFATAHTLVEARHDPRLRLALDRGRVEPDGMPLVWLGHRHGAERVAGPDFMPALIEAGVSLGRRHFFYGGVPGVPDQVAARLSAVYPGLRVAGTLSPPFRPLSSAEDREITALINAAEPDYIWVGLGTPKQDLWIADHRASLSASALFAVGAAFDLFAGRQTRAPKWMQGTGSEWIYRLLHEPRRLGRRYTVVNAKFAALVVRDQLRKPRRRETRLSVAIMGIRGVPANYGGFETFAEQLGVRLVAAGHDVTVYGRRGYVRRGLKSHHGVKLVILPAPPSKYLETVVHSLFSAFHALPRRYDVIYMCNSANVPAVAILALCRRRVVLNVDGLEWQRTKWNSLGKLYYRACARIAARLPIPLVTDAAVIQSYYRDAFARETYYFPYGTDLERVDDDGTLARLGLTERRYVLYVSRLEPENNAHVVIDGYADVVTDLPLVMVGDAPYAGSYIASLRSTTDSRVRFMGAIYGHGYHVLRSHAAAYVQATQVGGTHPALVEAMGYGNAIVANDVPEHRETLGDAGLYYSAAASLTEQLQRVLDDPDLADRLRDQAHRRAAQLYSWDAIAGSYESWLVGLTRGEAGRAEG